MVYIIIILLVMVMEYFMSAKWVPFYFRFGLPVYMKRFVSQGLPAGISGDYLNEVSTGVVPFLLSSLTFKNTAAGQWVLRQRSFRSSVMHGRLVVTEGNASVQLLGYLNWTPLVFIVAAVAMSIQRGDIEIVAVITVIFFVFYLLEKQMYNSFVDRLAGDRQASSDTK